jgi:hypothetical protein
MSFKEASKQKLRFSTSKGMLSSEQLWDLTLTDLNTCIRNQKKVLRKADGDDDLSFLDEDSKVDPVEQIKFDVLKEVYMTKKKDNEDLRSAKEKKEHNQKILKIIADKKDKSLEGKSIEELEAMLQ